MGGTSRYSKNTNRERGKIKDEYDCLKCGRQHSREKFWEELVFINSKPVNFKLDSGAMCNVLPYDVIENLERENSIKSTNKTIIAYGENKIKVIGEIILKCMIRKNEYKIKFIVVDVKSRPILGLNACIKLNLISKIDEIDAGINLRNEFINKNLSIFEGEGQITTNIPVSKKLLKPQVVDIYDTKLKKQFVTKNYYDKTARDRPTFAKTENILLKVRKEDKWVPGKIIDTHHTPRSYIVKEQNGSVYRRNSSFLRHSNLDSYNKNTNSSEGQKKHQEKVDYKCDKNSFMVQSNSSSVVSTKSGRIVKIPSWLNDYC
ncbi:hypothetical protein ILUMI_13743 [Ignelater luminosus]|uniref:Uncharacterized protein n=1 Tax=Ignelater luminosus TaxID=2038154 RepID=A0A8K0CRT5_IGNLU|nr:hypothetical protein ILUMI_13743 [Ignelater luminosus]